jgi:hypothetical protein
MTLADDEPEFVSIVDPSCAWAGAPVIVEQAIAATIE